tara:strand:- start:690 stop:1136 length:447 start_codon:yes stop_codon:yes gene_type:complete
LKTELNILWASMSGNAEDVAKVLNDKAQKMGFTTNKVELNDVSMTDFAKMKNVAIVTSTTGEGDLPTNGEDFWDDLNASSKELQNLNYSVCALGDRSHDIFCGAGKKVDEKLIQLKANKVLDRQECDGDDSGSDEWGNSFLEKIKSLQ